jgi:hypothetical protein
LEYNVVNRAIGPVMQMCHLVEDLDRSVEQWVRLGVGPFFVTRHPKYTVDTFRGQSVESDISAAFAYSGELQIELVQVHGRGPSAFEEFRQRHGYGLHHVGVLSNDLPADTALLAELGVQPFHRMVSALGVETVFFDVEQPGGAVLELIARSPVLDDGFAAMKAAAQAWDGSGPAVHEF